MFAPQMHRRDGRRGCRPCYRAAARSGGPAAAAARQHGGVRAAQPEVQLW